MARSEPVQPSKRLLNSERLAALRRTALLDSPAEASFDRLTRLAARILNAPISLVSLVDADRQFFKSQCGLPEPWASKRQTPLSHSFCQFVVDEMTPLVIEDAREHPLVRDNLAIRDLGVIAYLGVPLVSSDGEPLGSFCIIDHQPRRWTDTEVETVRELAVSVMTEIELRLAVARAEEQRKDKEALLQSTGEGIYGVDTEGACTFANPAAARMLGYTPEEMLGRDMHALIHHSHPDGTPFPAEQCPIRPAFTAGQEVRLEDEALWRRDGTFFPAAYSAFPLFRDGQLTGAVVTFSDISVRKRAEAERERVEATQRLLAEVGRAVVSTLDRGLICERVAGVVTAAAADWCAVYLLQGADELRLEALAHTDPERAKSVRGRVERLPVSHPESLVASVVRTGRAEIIRELTPEVVRSRYSDPELRRILEELALGSVLVVPLHGHQRVVGAMVLAAEGDRPRFGMEEIATAEEVGRRTALALENARLFHEAQEAVRSRDDVLGVVSHDLRNPVSTVFMASSFLLDLFPGQEHGMLRKQLALIKRAGERMNRLIQDLLDVTRMEAGQLVVAPEPTEVRSLLHEVEETFRPAAQDRGIALRCQGADTVPRVMADRDRVLQVFSNLIGNAVKFTPQGGSISLLVESRDGAAHFRVSDTGPGIPAEGLPHVFDRFWQANRATRQGAGLGLPIARGIVEAHGGRIWVESRPDEGTTFHFTLPVAG